MRSCIQLKTISDFCMCGGMGLWCHPLKYDAAFLKECGNEFITWKGRFVQVFAWLLFLSLNKPLNFWSALCKILQNLIMQYWNLKKRLQWTSNLFHKFYNASEIGWGIDLHWFQRKITNNFIIFFLVVLWSPTLQFSNKLFSKLIKKNFEFK